ncbi:MAG: hypothetical protein ACR2NU_14625 [Aeoliella sp.]
MLCRQFLAVTILTLQATIAQADPIDLSSRCFPGTARAVTIHLEFGGDLIALSQQENSTDSASEQTESQQVPVEVAAHIEYDEVALPLNGDIQRSARFYSKVDATINVGGKKTTPIFRDSRRLVVAEIDDQCKRLLAINGPLDRNEFETLDLWSDSLALDALLPDSPMAIGGTWKHDEKAMIGFTGLESLDVCEVSSVLIEANDRYARCKLAGTVHGVSHGARVELDLDANYLVDCQAGCIEKLNLAVRDERAIGPARPGLSGVVKLRFESALRKELHGITEPMIARVLGALPTLAPVVQTRSDSLGFAVAHDLAWYGAGTHRDMMTLRRVEGDRLIAHGTIAKLPAKSIDPERALADFRRDTVTTIGESMTNLISDEQWTNQHGCWVMGVVAEGEVSGVPIEWHTYLVASPEESPATHRMALTFTVEKSDLKRLAKRDRELVDKIELIPATGHRETAGRLKSSNQASGLERGVGRR